MKALLVDYDLAMAAAADAANRRMRRAGRTHWSRGDHEEACRVFDRVFGDRVFDLRTGEWMRERC